MAASKSLRLLLLQARKPDDPMCHHEVHCFVEKTGLDEEQIVPHSLLLGPPSLEATRGFDALLIGGSGDFYVSERNLPHFEALLEFLTEVVAVRHPTFASCFGYQSLVVALGGVIFHDPANTEVGTFELELTEAGQSDPLFAGMPTRLKAQMGHKDRARYHPDDVPNLASSARSHLQALRIPKAPIWATQFHPELDQRTNLERFDTYLGGYAQYMTATEREQARAAFTESPEINTLLERFLDCVFG